VTTVASVGRPASLLRAVFPLAAAAALAVGLASGDRGRASSGRAPLIAFQSDRDGDVEIYTMNPDGGDVRQLTRNHAYDQGPSWSPDGRRIAFTSDRAGNRELYVMNADGSGQRRLTHTPQKELFPTWAPDGRRIAVVREDKPNTFAGPIFAVNADGAGARRLGRARGADCCLDWSPDGKSIAAVDDNLAIVVWKLASGNATRLTSSPGGDCCPAWSPSGATIAFERDLAGNGKTLLYVMNANGTGKRRVSSLISLRPDFAGGRRIVFTAVPAGTPPTHTSAEIYFVNVDGSGLRRLTRNKASDSFPSWRS
jgi:Tol biopolymer transport system component